MALQIAQWNLELNLTGIPANRAYSPVGPNTEFIIPSEKNVLVKYITLDGIYSQSGDIVLLDYQLTFTLIYVNNQRIRNNIPIVTSGISIPPFINIVINKNNPKINLNEQIIGLGGVSSNVERSVVKLNNSVTPITGNVNLILSMYYVNL
jgi:hypothetical protein